jgi:hypothetical protein
MDMTRLPPRKRFSLTSAGTIIPGQVNRFSTCKYGQDGIFTGEITGEQFSPDAMGVHNDRG